nr:A_IG002N01.31 gene product [Arabidopsis thaliana]
MELTSFQKSPSSNDVVSFSVSLVRNSMARRRRSSAAESLKRRNDGYESLCQVVQQDSDRRLITIFVIFFIVIPAVSIAVYKVKFADRVIQTESSIRQKGIVKTDINFQEILTEHSKASENSTRHYDYPVLAYITPCQGSGLVLEGRHNADKGWIQELRSRGNALSASKGLPKLYNSCIFHALKRMNFFTLELVNFNTYLVIMFALNSREMEYNGIVLESWSRWAAYGVLHDPDLRKMALKFVKQLGDALHSTSSPRNNQQHMQFMYVVGPPRSEKLQMYDFGPEDLQFLKDSVDGFSLMTYDFSNPQNPGPNAPVKWIDLTLKLLLGSSNNIDSNIARKVLLGINFYGNDFVISGGGGGAITGRDYLALLQKHKPTFRWDKESGEHLFMYRDDKNIKHAVFYPTLMSILLRLENARLWGIGISIWEIGQDKGHFGKYAEASLEASSIFSGHTFDMQFRTNPRQLSRNGSMLLSLTLFFHFFFIIFNRWEKFDDTEWTILGVEGESERERVMEALKTATFSPMSVLSEKRSEPRKPFSLPNLFPPKSQRPISQESFLKRFNGGLALLTSVLSSATAPAKSLTYEEALQQSMTTSSSFDSDGLIEGISNFVTDNPLVIAGGVAALAVPFVLSQVLNKKPKSWGVESAKNAYTKLGTDDNAQLLDIRATADFRQVGSPNIKGLGKKAVSTVYNGEDKPGFLKKLSLKFKDPENTTLYILDKFDGNSELVAELVALNGFKSAYAIKDGAEGPRGWLNSSLPWIEPKKTLSLDLSSLTDSISGVFGESSDGVSVALGVAAAAGLSVFAFTEDRKQTLKQVDEFLNTKVAPKELVDELKEIGKALLPQSTSNKALPAPATVTAEAESATATTTTVDKPVPEPETVAATTTTVDKPVPEPEPVPEPVPVPAIEAAVAAQVITEPTETEAKPKPHSRPLSPYASVMFLLSHKEALLVGNKETFKLFIIIIWTSVDP